MLWNRRWYRISYHRTRWNSIFTYYQTHSIIYVLQLSAYLYIKWFQWIHQSHWMGLSGDAVTSPVHWTRTSELNSHFVVMHIKIHSCWFRIWQVFRVSKMVELADKMDSIVSYLPFLHNDLPILVYDLAIDLWWAGECTHGSTFCLLVSTTRALTFCLLASH
jgi:hypothetical protein